MPLTPRDDGTSEGVKTKAQRAVGGTSMEVTASPTDSTHQDRLSSEEVPVG